MKEDNLVEVDIHIVTIVNQNDKGVGQGILKFELVKLRGIN